MLSQAASKDPAMSGQLDYELRDHQFYATPPENVDCLATFIDLRRHVVWEPACGEGHISQRIARYCNGVFSTDLIDRGYGKAPFDFLEATKLPGNDLHAATAIITNPPYGDEAIKFIRTALELTKPVDGLVAMFMRNEYDMRSTDGAELFEGHPAYMLKICVTKRPRWIEGSKGSPRHNYAWYVWDWNYARDPRDGASIRYIHPKNAVPIGAPETTVQ
jgi:hypothetical protein